MPRSLPGDLQLEEAQWDKGLRNLWLVGLLAWALTRAPEILQKASVAGLGLSVNVGHVILIAPLLLVFGALTLESRARRIVELRDRLFGTDLVRTLEVSERAAWEIHDGFERVDLRVRPRIWWGVSRLLALWGLLVLQLLLVKEYFSFVDPDWVRGKCPSPGELFWKHLLFLSGPVKPRRCFDYSAAYQEQFPWILPPLSGWLYLGLLAWLGVLVWKTSKLWRARRLLGEDASSAVEAGPRREVSDDSEMTNPAVMSASAEDESAEASPTSTSNSYREDRT